MRDRKNRRKSSVGRVDTMEKTNWLIFTIIYAVIFGILSGMIKVYLNDMIYIWSIPFDAGTFVWLFGLALWGIISIFLQAHYKSK